MRKESIRMKKYQSKISGLACSFCVETIKKALKGIDGVNEVNISLSHEEILVKYDPNKVSEIDIKEVIKKLGYNILESKNVELKEQRIKEMEQAKKRLFFSFVNVLITIGIMISMWLGLSMMWLKYIMFSLAIITMFGPGLYIKKMAWFSLKRGILNQHVLLEFAAFSGLIGGIIGLFNSNFPIIDFFAVAVFVTAYHILSGWTSLIVRTKTSEAVERLLELQPKTAVVIRDGSEVIKSIDEIKINDIVRVRPGEKIPIDGVIIEGYTAIDESIISGEPFPVEKGYGDEVVGGSINLFGSVDIRVTKIGEDTFLSKIVKYVKEAKALKPSFLIIVDHILKYFVPAVLIVALISFLFWSIGSYISFSSFNIEKAIFSSLTVLIMGYPCALGMAMPLALLRGGSIAAEKGILMRSAEAFQTFPRIKKIIFDKTGTITKGELKVDNILIFEKDKEKIMSLIASAEMLSEHPIASAILRYINKFEILYSRPKEFNVFTGKGVSALVNNNKILVGKLSFLIENKIKISKKILEIARFIVNEGKTVIGVSVNNRVTALISITDVIKEEASNVIKKFKEINIEPILITGDNQVTAKAVGKKIGINQIYAEILPDKKANIIRCLQSRGNKVAMVGDGINDAPALMQADVGIAIGAGIDIAIESSDIIITGQSLEKVLEAYKITKESYNKTKQNLILAFLFNGIGIPLATTGLLSPFWAMIAMVLSVTTVLVNSFDIKLFGSKMVNK